MYDKICVPLKTLPGICKQHLNCKYYYIPRLFSRQSIIADIVQYMHLESSLSLFFTRALHKTDSFPPTATVVRALLVARAYYGKSALSLAAYWNIQHAVFIYSSPWREIAHGESYICTCTRITNENPCDYLATIDRRCLAIIYHLRRRILLRTFNSL